MAGPVAVTDLALSQFFDLMLEAGIEPDASKDEWLRVFSEDSELWPILKNGQMVGGVLFKGNTVHIAIKPEWRKRWITKSMLKAYPQWKPLIDVKAPIRKDNADSIALAKRLGFELLEETETHCVYVKRKQDEHSA